MKKHIISFLIIFYFFSSCGGMYYDDDLPRDTGGDDRRGEVEEIELPEHLADEGYVICSPEDMNAVGGMNFTDIITDFVSLKTPQQRVRACAYMKLTEAGDQLCSTRQRLEAEKEKARSAKAKASVQLSIDQLDRIQNRFVLNFDKANRRLYKVARKHSSSSSSNTGMQFLHWFLRDELEGWSYVSDTGYHLSCDVEGDEDEDSYNRGRRRNRERSDSRRRDREESRYRD